ncbi:conjugal transfer protein, partial [Klebsiella pneumoniae]|nr:conjugal transfer protein [Klebsiella pneumoniae]
MIVIDPKGDAELREICRLACEHIGQPEKFMMLHPAFASESIRLDLLKNWDRVSQVASRISLVLGSTNDDSFTGFCWNAVHRITSAMKYIGMRVNLVTLKNSMENRSATGR